MKNPKRRNSTMKDEDLEIAREVEGAQSVLVIRSRTKMPGKWWLLGMFVLMAAGAAMVCRQIYLAYDERNFLLLAFSLAFQALWLPGVAMIGWFAALAFFGSQEVRVGRRAVTSAMRVGRLGRTRRFDIGTQRPVALVDKTEAEVGGKPQFGVALFEAPDNKDNPFWAFRSFDEQECERVRKLILGEWGEND